MDHYKSVHPLKYYQDYLTHNIRPDGRKLNKFRNVLVNAGSIKTADGSAIVRIGNTSVACGIKAELGPPKPEEPESGFLVVNVDLPPLCSSQFRPGPPSDKAQVLTAYMNDVVTNCGIIDLKSLCIGIDKLVWTLYCDIICLNYDGAVVDACFTSLIAALEIVTLPRVDYNNDTNLITVIDSEKIFLNVLCKPIATSFAIFNDDTILVDPCGEEESLSIGIVSVVIANDELYSLHNTGGSPLPEDKLQKCISEAKQRTALMYQLIKAAQQP